MDYWFQVASGIWWEGRIYEKVFFLPLIKIKKNKDTIMNMRSNLNENNYWNIINIIEISLDFF